MASCETLQEQVNILSFEQVVSKSSEILNADAQQAKENIRRVISCAINNLRLREQWLLHNVDQIHECISDMLQSDARKAAEIKGKLEAGVEIGQMLSHEDSTSLSSYLSSSVKNAQNLLKQEKRYEQGALSFTCDKGQLLNTIQHFGKLCHANASLHSRNEAFHASLELDDCEAISTTSEDTASEKTCGIKCVISGTDIEDMDKQISKLTVNPSSFQSDYCKAEKIVCDGSVANSSDQPCCAEFCDDFQDDFYAAKIIEDMRQIRQRKIPVHPKPQLNSCGNDSKTFTDFHTTIADLEKQFDDIINRDVVDDMPRRYQRDKAVVCSVDALAQELEDIVNGSPWHAEPKLISLDTFNSPNSEVSTQSYSENVPDSDLPNTADKMKSFSLNFHPYLTKESLSVPTAAYQYLANNEKKQDEKGDLDFSYLDKIDGSTTVADLHSTIMEIIHS